MTTGLDLKWIQPVNTPNPCPVCGENMGHKPDFDTRKMIPSTNCANCEKIHEEQIAAEKAEKARAESLRRLEETRQNISAVMCEIGVPERYSTANIQTFDFTRLPHTVQICTENAIKGKSIYFYGMPGTGKTHIAAAITHKCLYNGSITANECRFVTVPDLLAWVREGITLERHEPRIQLYCTIKMLVLDDLGAERPTEYAKETLYRIINERYNKRLHTIITSNYAPEKQALAQHLGSRLTSRLSSMQNVYTGDNDYRRGGAGW